MIWKGLLWGIVLVLVAFVVGWIRNSARVVKLQKLLTNDFFRFTGYLYMKVGEAEHWEAGYDPIPGAMRLLFEQHGTNQCFYMKYKGGKTMMKAIDDLIADYRSEMG